jgi:hypothetical protein
MVTCWNAYAEGVPAAADRDQPADRHDERGEHQVEHVEAVVAQPRRGRGRTDRRQRDAGAATGEVGGVVDDLAQALGDAQRGDREVVAPQAQQWPADDRGEDPRDDGGDRQGEPERQPQVHHDHGGGVRAEAEEADLPEAGVAGVPADEVPRGGQPDEHEHRADRTHLAGVQLSLQTHRADQREEPDPPRHGLP